VNCASVAVAETDRGRFEYGENEMSAEAKKGYGSTLALLLLGVLALQLGAGWLVVLIPVAALVWLGARSAVPSGRN
jgi:hypothetical protein